MGITVNDVTIVVATKGRRPMVEKLLKNVPHRPLLLVVEPDSQKEDLPEDLAGADVLATDSGKRPSKAFEEGIMAAKTSHFVVLCDDVTPASDWLDQAVAAYNHSFTDKDGVVVMNDSDPARPERMPRCDFYLSSKAFYVEHLFPVPYRHYCQDNEIWEKARRLGLGVWAEAARIPHHDEGEHDWKVQAEDNGHYFDRMRDFMRVNDGKVKRKLFIALPIYWDIDPLFFAAFIAFLGDAHRHGLTGENFHVEHSIGDSAVGRARNRLTRRFLESDCTHMLFIDTDLVFGADQVARIFAHEADVVGGFYPKKQQGNIEMVCNALPEKAEANGDGLLPLRYVGTGFLRISRRALELMIQHFGKEMEYKADGSGDVEWDFWRMGCYDYKDGSRRWLSEDWWFCQKWLDLGGQVYGDGKVLLKHSGSAVYPLKDQEQKIFNQGKPLNADLSSEAKVEAGAGNPHPVPAVV